MRRPARAEVFEKIPKVHSRLRLKSTFWIGLVLLGLFLACTYGEGKPGLLSAVFFPAGLGAALLVIHRLVERPVRQLTEAAQGILRGDSGVSLDTFRGDEIGSLAESICELGRIIEEKNRELNEQKGEYQTLFEQTPCYITVQDRDFRIIKYNQEFAEKFSPEPGDYCYRAYKGRSERCVVCPVMKTFQDGKSHYSEEEGVKRNGSKSYWLVRTSPIRNVQGEVVAAMEMSLDLTQTKHLEEALRKSEEKYRLIFNTIPDPVFVLDERTLEIIDCNESLTTVYGFSKEEALGRSFLDFFPENEREHYLTELQNVNVINQTRQVTRKGEEIFVHMRISPSELDGKRVLLVITCDITKRLMAEQQLIQASKMATLGEMATGVAHELNQPLSVMKTASTFLIKKVRKGEPIEDETLKTLAEEIDNHVDRASKIILHMREFGRKSDVTKEKVYVNEVLTKALEIFSQQLKLREIQVVTDFQRDLPMILADANRLEQVFVNLLINSRDAIEEKSRQVGQRDGERKILLRTRAQNEMVTIEVKDTGVGIPEGIRDKIFEPFFTTKRVGKGTGLGLSITYGIIQDYGGMIRVESQEGTGSNFIIQFPVANEA